MGFFSNDAPLHNNPLVPVVSPMSVAAKQAMYAAASKGLIARGTWDGCAWNAASRERGFDVNTSTQASRVFGDSPSVVSTFIRVWDRLPGEDEACTRMLIEALEKVGITDKPNRTRAVRIVRGYAFKSLDSKFKEELEKVSDISDMPGITEEMADSVKVLLNA